MMIIIVLLLVAIIIGLMFYNMSIHKKIDSFKNINQQITSINVLQEFMDTISETSSVDDKLKKINDILIEKYGIKYSTIVVYNGAEFVIRASNVAENHWETLKNLQSEPVFADSIETGIPKYITVEKEGDKLPYQKMEFGRAKSAIFFPLYIDNVYIGYWIIESGTPHDFDNVDTTVLEVIKENIVSVLKTVVHQKTLESIVRKDLFTGLYSEEYLYGEGKKIIDQYTISTMCMFKIINIQQINQEYCRELGNKVITQISNYIRENISSEYVFVRYMGPKFVIAFSGVEASGVADFINEIKEKVENMKIQLTEEEIEHLNLDAKLKNKLSKNVKEIAIPKLNFVISS